METVIVLVGLLALMVACVVIGGELNLPYPILILLASVGITFIPGFPTIDIPPEIILPIFLPPLLFETAQSASWGLFKTRWRTVATLALGLTATTALAVAGLTWMLFPEVSFAVALGLGAMVAPPDPVAVEAVAKPAKMPRRLMTLLQTEGLFNDAVAIVLFQAATNAIVRDRKIMQHTVIIDFVLSAALAVGIGFLMGWVYRVATRHVKTVDASVAVSLIVPFAAYLLADEVHASGVVAVVVAAVETNRNRSVDAGEERIVRSAFWDVINLIVNGLVFGLMGIELHAIFKTDGWGIFRYFGPISCVCVTVIAVRFVVVFMYLFFIEGNHDQHHGKRKRGEKNQRTMTVLLKETLLLTWCGMRGVATLALALSLPAVTSSGQPLPGRSFVIVAAASVLIVTLVPTGLTLPVLTRVLNIRQNPKEAHRQLEMIVRKLQQESWRAVRKEFPGDSLTSEMREVLRARFITLRQELGLDVSNDLFLDTNLGFITPDEVDDPYGMHDLFMDMTSGPLEEGEEYPTEAEEPRLARHQSVPSSDGGEASNGEDGSDGASRAHGHAPMKSDVDMQRAAELVSLFLEARSVHDALQRGDAPEGIVLKENLQIGDDLAIAPDTAQKLLDSAALVKDTDLDALSQLYTDPDRTEPVPDVTKEDVVDALTFVTVHRKEIADALEDIEGTALAEGGEPGDDDGQDCDMVEIVGQAEPAVAGLPTDTDRQTDADHQHDAGAQGTSVANTAQPGAANADNSESGSVPGKGHGNEINDEEPVDEDDLDDDNLDEDDDDEASDDIPERRRIDIQNLSREMVIAGDAARAVVLKAREREDVDPLLADRVLRILDMRMLATPEELSER
ncbi:MAG: sodium:proton antiporter [Actinomycetaceae bacterium]|nr:sodium:proton antiporter [Actinomycetaceae bacterium]MDY6083479.1 sodium:proton antiporter [Actinomycetaceae bacterium]